MRRLIFAILLAVTGSPVEQRAFGGLRLAGAWRLANSNEHFHGYSALVAMADGTFLAGSDRGLVLADPAT